MTIQPDQAEGKGTPLTPADPRTAARENGGPPPLEGVTEPLENLDSLIVNAKRTWIPTWLSHRLREVVAGGPVEVRAEQLTSELDLSARTINAHRSGLREAEFLAWERTDTGRYLWRTATPDWEREEGPPFVEGRCVQVRDLRRLLHHPDVKREWIPTWITLRLWQDAGGGPAWVGEERLASELDCSVRTVRGHRTGLREAGFLRRERTASAACRWWATVPQGRYAIECSPARGDRRHKGSRNPVEDLGPATFAGRSPRETARDTAGLQLIAGAYAYFNDVVRIQKITRPTSRGARVTRARDAPANGPKNSSGPAEEEEEITAGRKEKKNLIELREMYRESIPLPPAGGPPRTVTRHPREGFAVSAKLDEQGRLWIHEGAWEEAEDEDRSATMLPPEEIPGSEMPRWRWIELAEMPVDLGKHPDTGEPMKKGSGARGPYVIHGDGEDTRFVDLHTYSLLELGHREAVRLVRFWRPDWIIEEGGDEERYEEAQERALADPLPAPWFDEYDDGPSLEELLDETEEETRRGVQQAEGDGDDSADDEDVARSGAERDDGRSRGTATGDPADRRDSPEQPARSRDEGDPAADSGYAPADHDDPADEEEPAEEEAAEPEPVVIEEPAPDEQLDRIRDLADGLEFFLLEELVRWLVNGVTRETADRLEAALEDVVEKGELDEIESVEELVERGERLLGA